MKKTRSKSLSKSRTLLARRACCSSWLAVTDWHPAMLCQKARQGRAAWKAATTGTQGGLDGVPRVGRTLGNRTGLGIRPGAGARVIRIGPRQHLFLAKGPPAQIRPRSPVSIQKLRQATAWREAPSATVKVIIHGHPGLSRHTGNSSGMPRRPAPGAAEVRVRPGKNLLPGQAWKPQVVAPAASARQQSGKRGAARQAAQTLGQRLKTRD